MFKLKKIKRYLENYPLIYVKIAYYYNIIKGGNYNRVVNKTTQICIEGFPRSSNSFVAEVFRYLHDDNISIATHLHSSAHIIYAVESNIPTCVLIRKPKDSIVSLFTLSVQFDKTYKTDSESVKKSMEYDLKWYIFFYKSLIKYKDKIVIASMEESTSDICSVIKKINKKYSTSFNNCTDHQQLVEVLSASSKPHVFPSEFRNKYKQFGKEVYHSIDKVLRNEAEDVYNKFIS